jgi:cell division protein FtsB
MNPEERPQSRPESEQSSTSGYASDTTHPFQPPTQKKSKAPRVLGSLLVLALITCGTLGWFSYDQMSQRTALQEKVNDQDKQINKLVTQVSETAKTTVTEEQAEVQAEKSETDSVIKAGLAVAKADVTYANKTLEASVTKAEDGFAAVSVVAAPNGPNFKQILKKSDGIWVVIFQGPNEPSEAIVMQYDIPANIAQP